jgi:hypothetical protein
MAVIVQRQPVAHTQLTATVLGDPTVRCRAARAYNADLLPTHSLPLQCRVTRQFGVVRHMRVTWQSNKT